MSEPLSIGVGEVTLAGERRPGDGPTVVLLHAGVCDRRSWRGVAERLAAEGFDVLAYDRRGFGETPPTDSAFRHLDDLAAVLDAAADGPVWLVGSSMGGALALDAALDLGGRVAGLVLLAPAISGSPEPELEELDEPTKRLGLAIDAADEAGDLDEVNRLETVLWLDGPAGPDGRVGGEARELVLDMNGIALRAETSEDAGESGVDAWTRLEEIRIPVTVACGDLDVPFTIAQSRDVADRVADLRTHRIVAGTAHLPYLERPAEIVALIRAAVGRR